MKLRAPRAILASIALAGCAAIASGASEDLRLLQARILIEQASPSSLSMQKTHSSFLIFLTSVCSSWARPWARRSPVRSRRAVVDKTASRWAPPGAARLAPPGAPPHPPPPPPPPASPSSARAAASAPALASVPTPPPPPPAAPARAAFARSAAASALYWRAFAKRALAAAPPPAPAGVAARASSSSRPIRASHSARSAAMARAAWRRDSV